MSTCNNAQIDRASANNYRIADSMQASCNDCTRKQAVPFFWCPVVDRQVRPHMTCDQHAAEVN